MCTEENLSDKIARLFWFSAIWTIGSGLDERGKPIFNEFILNLSGSFLTQDSIFDVGLDENLQWIKWDDSLPSKWSLNKGSVLKIHFHVILISENVIILCRFLSSLHNMINFYIKIKNMLMYFF